MSTIDGIGNSNMSPSPGQSRESSPDKSEDGGFRSTLSKVGRGAAAGASKLVGALPGGAVAGAVVNALSDGGGASSGLPGGGDDQIDKMFEMQKQSQAFNLQYLELQNRLQEDNRQFSTLTNLMKVRHDTAKAAINNMHA